MEFNEDFEILEEDIEEKKAETNNTQVCCWVGTWNNPKMTDEAFEKFFNELYIQNIVTYAIFQREKGEKSGIIHFQYFVCFRNAKRSAWLKKNLPYGCHFKPMRTTKTLCSNYCSKEDTRVSGPYEIGELIEKGARTDLARSVKMVREGVAMEDISNTFETSYVMNRNKLKDYQKDLLEWKYGKVGRNLEVIYIYGPERTGKTSYVYSQVDEDPNKLFVIDNYGKYLFSGYVEQKAVLFDEFTGDGQVEPITYMNKLLEPRPMRLRCLGGVTPACYEKVYIVSNYSLNEVYKKAQEGELYNSYKAFCARINKIIHFTSFNKFHIEKETIWEDIPENEIAMKGITKRAKEVYKYDISGKKTKVWDRYVPVQLELLPVEPLDETNLPFDD